MKAKGRIFDIQKYSIHDGPGIRTIVFLKGCALRCRWCCNPESQEFDIQTMMFEGKEKVMGYDVTVEDVMPAILQDTFYYNRSGGGVTLSGGEALLQPNFGPHLLHACKDYGINTAIETTGFARWEFIEKYLPYLDYVLMDIKHMNSAKHKEFTTQPNELIHENAKRIAESGMVDLTIRVPVIPTFNATPEEIYDIAMDGIDDEVDDAKEQVKEAKKTLAAYEKMVKNGVITSDYAGTILSLGYAEGDTLNTSTAIASFADADAVTVTVSVSQEDVSTIAIGDVVNIVFSAYEEETYSGVVSAIDTAETSDNSSMIDYDVTVKVTGDVFKIYQGMTSNVTFITKELKNVVYVSNKAIQTEGTKSYVKKKEGNTIVKKEVVTGFSNGSSVEIQSGLEEGDVVLIESQVSSS